MPLPLNAGLENALVKRVIEGDGRFGAKGERLSHPEGDGSGRHANIGECDECERLEVEEKVGLLGHVEELRGHLRARCMERYHTKLL